MYFDYSKRDCLLPSGCKDLIDVLKLHQPKPLRGEPYQPRLRKPIPPITRHVKLPSSVSVEKLIELSGKKPIHIISDLMDLGVFVNIHGSVTFDIAARVLLWYGIATTPEA